MASVDGLRCLPFSEIGHITKVLRWTVRVFSSVSTDAACKQFTKYKQSDSCLYGFTSIMRSTCIDDAFHQTFQDLLWVLRHGSNNESELSQTRASTRYSKGRKLSMSYNKLLNMILDGKIEHIILTLRILQHQTQHAKTSIVPCEHMHNKHANMVVACLCCMLRPEHRRGRIEVISTAACFKCASTCYCLPVYAAHVAIE